MKDKQALTCQIMLGTNILTALTIEHLNKTYGNGLQALKDINLRVEQGDFFRLARP